MAAVSSFRFWHGEKLSSISFRTGGGSRGKKKTKMQSRKDVLERFGIFWNVLDFFECFGFFWNVLECFGIIRNVGGFVAVCKLELSEALHPDGCNVASTEPW